MTFEEKKLKELQELFNELNMDYGTDDVRDFIKTALEEQQEIIIKTICEAVKNYYDSSELLK